MCAFRLFAYLLFILCVCVWVYENIVKNEKKNFFHRFQFRFFCCCHLFYFVLCQKNKSETKLSNQSEKSSIRWKSKYNIQSMWYHYLSIKYSLNIFETKKKLSNTCCRKENEWHLAWARFVPAQVSFLIQVALIDSRTQRSWVMT